MSDDLFMRDDIIQFSNKLDTECFNIKAYRKHKSKAKKVSILGQLTNDLGYSQQNILKHNNSLQKRSSHNNHDDQQQRRISMTAGIKRRADLSQNLRNFNKSVNIRQQMASHKKQQSLLYEVKTARINYNANDVNQKSKTSWMNDGDKGDQEKEVKSKYRQLEQQHHKTGPINDRAIQNWLNQILTEYCHQQQFDKSIENSALKKMSIDRNSLLSQGINPEYVNRVYKSMFVYSIGFNNLLKQLSGKNGNLKKTIWKVYAILLEFCSQGTFETMIGEIERDKARKIQSLREEIEKRQRVIEDNDEINQERNGKIYKELKLLREENINLENQKNVLIQDFKEAEQSFNQQVSMRLKFQNKINEIHGIHHELSTKHARLYDDYHKKVYEIEVLEKNQKELLENFLIVKDKLARTTEELEEQKRDNVAMHELVTKYEQMRTRFQNSEIDLKSSKQDLQNIIKQKLRKISQLQVELQNNEIMLNLSKSSHTQLEQQYKQQLQQNKKLYTTIRQQIAQLNELFTDKKNFNETHLSYVAQIEFLKNKESEMKIVVERLKKEGNGMSETTAALLVERVALEKRVEHLGNDLASCYESIESMKRTKNIYQEELTYLKKKSETHGEVVREKDTAILTLTKENQKITKENQEMLTLNKNLDSKTTVLAQRLKSEQQISKKKYDKLKEQRDQLYKDNSEHGGVMQEKLGQLQRYMSLYDKEMLNLKNQRFERVNLDLRYKQSLQVMESENQHIRNLNIIISENHEEIEEWKRRYRSFEYILKQKEHLFEVERTKLKMLLQDSRKQVAKKKMFVNPMLMQDLRGLLARAIQKYGKLFEDYNKKQRQARQVQQSLNHQIELNKHEFNTQLNEEHLKGIKSLQEKQYEIEFQRQKSKHLQNKLDEFQKIIVETKRSEQTPNSNKEKERKYLNTIKEKSQQIEKMLKQLENAHDHNNTLINRIGEIEKIIKSKDQEISQCQKNAANLTHQMELERQKLNQNNRHKETISSRMDDYDENLLTAMNHQPHNNITSPYQKDNLQRPSSIRQSSQSSNRKLNSKEKNDSQKQEQPFGTNVIRQKGKMKGEKVVNPVWRNDFGKKLKNAVNYYQK